MTVTDRAEQSPSPLPSRTRTAGWLRTAGVVFLGYLTTVPAVSAAAERHSDASMHRLAELITGASVGLGYALALLLPWTLLWRRTRSAQVYFGNVLICLVVPVGPVVAGIALVHVLRKASNAMLVKATALYSTAVVLFLVLDLRGADATTSFVRFVMAPTETSDAASYVISVPQFTSVLMVLIGLPLLVGLYLRERHTGDQSRRLVVAEQASREVISDQVRRQAERERIAREVHDVIGHRLSLLSLHAGGLEMAAGADERLRESAALVRTGAQAAMEDLRSLITVLRADPEDEVHDDGPISHGLHDLDSVIDDTADAGTPVVSTVFLQGTEHASPALSRATYRIVQELLTNARRHSSNSPTRLLVNGRPGAGLQIEAVNRSAAPGPPGNGLTGIRERVELLGGQMASGPDGQGNFRVSVRLPWEQSV